MLANSLNSLTLLVAAGVVGLAVSQQTLNGSIQIPTLDTYLMMPNFTGNASEGYVSVRTKNTTIAGLLSKAQKATFISYDEEFAQMVGPSPEAVLIEERSDAFAFECATYDYPRHQIWFTSSIVTDQPTVLYRLNLTDNAIQKVATPMINPNGGYYYKGWVYMVYFGNLTTNPGIARVNAETYETEFLLNNYFGLPFNGPDDIVVLPANHDNNGVVTDHIYFTDNTYGGLVAKTDSVYALPNAVWRFTPATGALVPVISRADIVGANGIRANVNGTKLYVGEFDSLTSGLDIGVENIPGTSGIFEFDIDSRGFPINKRLFGVSRFGSPDGLHTDDYGRVWTGESDGIVVRNRNGQIIGIFNQLTLKDQKIAGAIAQLSLAEDTLIIFAQTRLWRIQLAQTVKKGGSAGN